MNEIYLLLGLAMLNFAFAIFNKRADKWVRAFNFFAGAFVMYVIFELIKLQ